MRCPRCGNNIPNNSKTCTVCGLRLIKKPPKGNHRLLIGALCALLIVASVLVLLFTLLNNDVGGIPSSSPQPISTPTSTPNSVTATSAPSIAPSVSPSPIHTLSPDIVVDSVTLQYNGSVASKGHLYMYSDGSTLTVEVEIVASSSISPEDIVWESSDSSVATTTPSEDGSSCVLTKRGDGECVVTVSVGEISDSLTVVAAPYGSVNGVTTSNLFSSLPDYFYFSSNAGGWWTRIYVNDDGSFNGLYMDSDWGYGWYEEVDDVPVEYDIWYYRYCSFSGQLEIVEQVGNYEFVLRVTDLTYDNTPNTWEEITDEDGEREIYIYTEPYGFSQAEELYLYLPGRETSDLAPECIQWIKVDVNDFEDRNYLKYWGLYNPNDKVAFAGMNGEFPGEPATA